MAADNDTNAKEEMAYYVPHIPNGGELEYGIDGHYYPGIAKANEPGHYYVTDWDWGTDHEAAQKYADEANEKLGLTKDEAHHIIIRSMFGKKVQR